MCRAVHLLVPFSVLGLSGEHSAALTTSMMLKEDCISVCVCLAARQGLFNVPAT